VIGTHSRKIEGDLMDLMVRAGWSLAREQPSKVSFGTGARSLSEMLIHDGTQVWRNPSLSC